MIREKIPILWRNLKESKGKERKKLEAILQQLNFYQSLDESFEENIGIYGA